MPYGWKIELNSIDITDKISGFSITCSMSNFCSEMTLDFADASYYAGLDFSQISESPEIEIFTKTGTEWVSQGKFYIERPALADAVNSEIMQGVWGRSTTAVLSEPFAVKVTKTWETKTTFFAICEEMCDLCGFTWDSAYSEISDFVIFPYTYEAENLYPIDVITDLAMLAGAVITTDRLGHLCIKQTNYSPSAADETITDDDISVITESPEWPVFANRLRITPVGALASYDVDLIIPNPCLPADAATKTKLFAQVKDADGNAVAGIIVNWSIDSDTASLQAANSNTQEIVILHEQKRSKNYYDIDVDFEPSYVDAVYAYSDTARATNLAEGGYLISGKTITLTDKLAYCDQLLVIDYRVAGMAVNHLIPGTTSDDVTVTADVEGHRDDDVVYIDNPCQCPPSLSISAAPSSINKSATAKMLVYAEDSGPITSGRQVFMAEKTASKKGTLAWTSARLGTVNVSKEKTRAINEVAGLTQCECEMYPASVTSVYATDAEGDPTGSNLYASHDNKLINLTSTLPTGAALLVTYTAQGAALNRFTGNNLGEALINAYMLTNREEGLEASVTIRIVDNTDPISTYPSDWGAGDDDGGYGGIGGLDEEEEEYEQEHEDTPGADFNYCVPDNVSDDPTPEALAGRFATAVEHDCDCTLLCNEELAIYSTIQGFDGASGRSISKIVKDDYGLTEGSPEYWEKYEEIKTEALEDCMAACGGCCVQQPNGPFEFDKENTPETIAAGGSIELYVKGGCGPFTFFTKSLGYFFDAGLTETEIETASRSITLHCVEAAGACGEDYDIVARVCAYDSCTGDINLPPVWQPETYYYVNQVVQSGNWYRCIVNHTSALTFYEDLAAGYWEETPQPAPDFVKCVEIRHADGKWANETRIFECPVSGAGTLESCAEGGLDCWAYIIKGDKKYRQHTYRIATHACSAKYDCATRGDWCAENSFARTPCITNEAYEMPCMESVSDPCAEGGGLIRCNEKQLFEYTWSCP